MSCFLVRPYVVRWSRQVVGQARNLLKPQSDPIPISISSMGTAVGKLLILDRIVRTGEQDFQDVVGEAF